MRYFEAGKSRRDVRFVALFTRWPGRLGEASLPLILPAALAVEGAFAGCHAPAALARVGVFVRIAHWIMKFGRGSIEGRRDDRDDSVSFINARAKQSNKPRDETPKKDKV